MSAAMLVAAALGVAAATGAVAADPGPLSGPPPSAAQLAGQRIIEGFSGTTVPAGLAGRVRRGEVAGVIIMGGNVRSPAGLRRLTARLQSIPRPARLDAPLLVMVDQEGGRVRRLPGAPLRSAAELGAAPVAVAHRAGLAAGRLLARSGVNVNLAPVADVGPPGSALGRDRRLFGTTPRAVAARALAFERGQRRRGILGTAKHFPGFGGAGVSTDDAPVTITATRARLRGHHMAPFAALIEARIPLVMTTSAIYRSLDPGTPALLSARIVRGELRHRLGFGGVVVTDALDTPALAAAGDPARVAVRAARAGNDLLLYISPAAASRGREALRRELAAGRLDRDGALEHLNRVMALRRGIGGG